MQIMKTVQISKNNTARLQYLAHSVAEHLVSIAEHMDGKWDGATDNLKSQMDAFDAVLQDISKLLTKYSKSSPVVAFINAGDRDMAIQRLERRLADTRTSILVLLGVDASISLHHIATGVDRFTHALESQAFHTQSHLQSFGNRFDQVHVSLRSRVEDTYSRVVRLEDAIRGHAAQTLGDTGLPLYNMHELRVLKTISRGYTPLENHVTVTLREAQHRTTGQVVLVRSYEGSNPYDRTTAFSRDVARRTNIWEPNILQLVGTCAATSPMLFQVYDTPGGQVEGFLDWLRRTAAANPVETICGLYDMLYQRTSLKALSEFENSRDVHCESLFYDSAVNMRTDGSGRLSWALLHTGEIERGSNWPLSWGVQRRYFGFPWGKTPGTSVVDTFRRGSGAWAEGAQGLDALFKHGVPSLDTATLGSILLENGWLGANTQDGLSHSSTVGLGDVGYMTEDHHFVVVSNFHSLLTSTDGVAPTWAVNVYHDPGPFETNVVVERSGKSYKRYESQKPSLRSCTLEYVNLDKRHAWKVLREHACATIVRHAPAVNAHDLRLITSYSESCSFWTQPLQDSKDGETFSGLASNSICVDKLRIQDSNDTETWSGVVPESDADTAERLTSMYPPDDRDIDEHSSPLYYIFENEAVHVRDSGSPELSPWAWASFQPDPEWPDDEDPLLMEREMPNFDSKRVRTRDGYELLKRFESYTDSLQLPFGVALPYVEEVGDS